MEQNLAQASQPHCYFHYFPPGEFYPGTRSHTRAQTQTNTDTYTDTSRHVSSPTALLLGGEVNLEVVRVVVDVEEAAALVELTDTLDGTSRVDGRSDFILGFVE